MNTKLLRLGAIKRLISTSKVSNQEEILEELIRSGYELTQATLSRDLKEIRAGRIHDPEKGSIYILQEQLSTSNRTAMPEPSPESILLVSFSYNLVLIKTYPGFASSTALFIDNSKKPEFAGTIAGDDTILLIPTENFSRREILNALDEIFPGIKSRTAI